MSAFFRPGRALRRAQSGQSCPGCGLRIHANNDIVLYAAPERTYFLHEACAEILAEQAAAASAAEEDATETAASDGTTALDVGTSSIAQEAT